MKNFVEIFLPLSLHSFQRKTPVKREKREFSSAGSEHLPYKQRVGGSNPSTPTKVPRGAFLFSCETLQQPTNVSVAQLVEQLTLNQRVRSSSLRGDTGNEALRSVRQLGAFLFEVTFDSLSANFLFVEGP